MNYKEQIEKRAGMYSQNGELFLDGDDYDDFGLDINPNLRKEDHQKTWKKVINDSHSFINNHPKKQDYFKEEEYNSAREKIKHPHSSMVRKAGAIVGGALPLTVGAISGGLKAKPGKLSKTLGAVSGGTKQLPMAALGAMGGGLAGVMRGEYMDERYRDKHHGKWKYDVEPQIIDDLYAHMKGKHYGYDKTASDIVNEAFEKVANEKDIQKTIVFDFDGVIHSYKSGWKGTTNIPDEPVEGIREAIEELRKYYKIVIVSTRCFQKGGIDAIKKWLKEHDIQVDDVLKEKPPAIMYVDDNAICFNGNPKNLIKQIKNFKNWMDK